jgi:hypothetical protein
LAGGYGFDAAQQFDTRKTCSRTPLGGFEEFNRFA